MQLYTQPYRQRVYLLLASIVLFALLVWPVSPANAQVTLYARAPAGKQDDLLYIVSFSSVQQPYGPLVVYRAFGSDLRTALPVVAVPRGSSAALSLTPVLFPSPDGRTLALLNPLSSAYDTNLNGASLGIIPSDGHSSGVRLLALHVALAGPVVWSADNSALYYLTGRTGGRPLDLDLSTAPSKCSGAPCRRQATSPDIIEQIHRVDLRGQDTLLFSQPLDQGSIRPVGLDRNGALILVRAQSGSPVTVLRLSVKGSHVTPTVVMALPRSIQPGNILRVGSDGASLIVDQGSYQTLTQIAFATRAVTTVTPLFDTGRYGGNLLPLARSRDGTILAMSQVLSVRGDLAAQGIENVPAQERLLLVDARSGAWQSLQLPPGGQITRVFWSAPIAPARLQHASLNTLTQVLPGRQRSSNGPMKNATVNQQDEWMLEGHANQLFDGPALPTMCYGLCSSSNSPPHVSAAILHGVAYTESDWHQFNTLDFQVNGEPAGSPLESFDGGWGEYQQTWGMPPQCNASNNCRGDVFRIEHDQSYNIGVGIQSLIYAWNNTAGVFSNSDPNDPYKANDWFFAVWAYNGAYGNNPNDVPSSQYGHWYPGAPFNSIYEERVWYFAAHPQYSSTGWTDNYIPSLGPSLLPPQSDFTSTSDNFVYCVTCTIPDWTTGSYDRNWVGYGSPDSQFASSFTTAFAQSGGESVLGLPRDNGGGAAVHRWGNGWAQDFGGGSDRPGALLLADSTGGGASTPYWVYGNIWTQYLVADRGTPGCHGYPTSNLNPFSDPGLGSDTYLRQTFQQGYMVWDATINVIATDVCA